MYFFSIYKRSSQVTQTNRAVTGNLHRSRMKFLPLYDCQILKFSHFLRFIFYTGLQHNIYDKPPAPTSAARFGSQGPNTYAHGNQPTPANAPYPVVGPPTSHPSSSSSSSLTSHSSASSIMYAPKSAITNMYTGRMGQTTFQEQVVARQKVGPRLGYV